MRLAIATALLLLAGSAAAQALNGAWLGQWLLAQGPAIPRPPASIEMRVMAGVNTWLSGGQQCELAYDGTVAQQAIAGQLKSLKDWQLSPAHWPAGTDPAQLVGLQKEFNDAESALRNLPPGNYRRLRLRGDACDTRDDLFYLLNVPQQRIYQFRFPQASLGAGVAVYLFRSR
ncbi:MAG: hypothetical protein ABI907_09420 [Ramlibacter sp.]